MAPPSTYGAAFLAPACWLVSIGFLYEIEWGKLHTNFLERLSEIAVPTLLLHGAQERAVPVAWAERAIALSIDVVIGRREKGLSNATKLS